MTQSNSGDASNPRLVGMVESFGDGAPRYHVRDDEAMIRRLPGCELTALERDHGMRLDVTICPLTLRLPDAMSARAMEVPRTDAGRGWHWGKHDYVLLNIFRNPDLPRLSVITIPRPGFWQLEVAGRPMCVSRASPGDAGWPRPDYLAGIHGYLDDATEFSAEAVAPTPTRREELLAAVATLEHHHP